MNIGYILCILYNSRRMDFIITCLLCMILLCQFDVVRCKQCIKHDNCICVFDDDSGMIDLSSIGRTDGTPYFLDIPSTTDDYVYSYNPCGPFDEVSCIGVAACQYSYYQLIGYDIGVPDKVSYDYNGLNVIVQYSSSDGVRNSYVTLVCDPNANTPSLDVTGELETTKYYMTLTAAAACPVPSPFSPFGSSGLSGGSILLIILFVLLAVYLAAGIAFNKFKRGANGKELVPNLGFWTALPGLIKDGTRFTLSKICKGRVSYEAI